MIRWMGTILILLSAVLLSAGMGYAQDEDPRSSEAAAAYQSGDYVGAAALYEAMLVEGIVSPGLYVNLGAAYYQQGDLGQSLLNYRRAHRLDPRDTDAAAMIARIRSERIDLQVGGYSLIDAVGQVFDGLTRQELSWLSVVVWWGWIGLVIAVLLSKRWRALLRDLNVVAGGAALLLLVLVVVREYVDTQRPVAVVVEPVVDIYSGPGEAYLAIGRLYSAAELRVIAGEGNWVRFLLPDGRQGWLPVDAIEEV